MTQTRVVDEKAVLVYLNTLRGSGQVNMYAAGPYLREDLGLSRAEAEHYIVRYMRSTVRGQFAPKED